MSERLPPRERVYWEGAEIKCCTLCNNPIDRFFVNGLVVRLRDFTILCLACHGTEGIGLGSGKGQKYRKEFPSERFYILEG